MPQYSQQYFYVLFFSFYLAWSLSSLSPGSFTFKFSFDLTTNVKKLSPKIVLLDIRFFLIDGLLDNTIQSKTFHNVSLGKQ